MTRAPMTTVLAALAAGLALAPVRAPAQGAGANGLVGSGAGPMTMEGGASDRRAGGARSIPYSRPVVGGITAPAPPPRDLPPGEAGWHRHRPWRAPVTLPDDVPARPDGRPEGWVGPYGRPR